MWHSCPNCREPITYWRVFRTPAWSSFRCKACGSVLGVSLGRRLMTVLIWLVVFVSTMEVTGLFIAGRWLPYVSAFISLFAVMYFFDKVTLIDRRAFTCKHCGYELEWLSEPRCPECGTQFDPAERERIMARINAPAPASNSRRFVLIFVVLVLSLSMLVAGTIVFWRNQPAAPIPPAKPVTPKPTTTN